MVAWECVTLVLPGVLVGYRMLSVHFVRYDSCNAYVIGNTNQIHFWEKSRFKGVGKLSEKLRHLLLVFEAKDNGRKVERFCPVLFEGDQFSSILESYTGNAVTCDYNSSSGADFTTFLTPSTTVLAASRVP